MNRKYLITSTSWQGEVELLFSDESLECKDGNMLLVRLDLTRAELTEQQHIWFLRSLPRELPELQSKLANTSATLTEVPIEITFADFVTKYKPRKGDSHRTRTEAKWNKLSKADQAKAYNYIDKYFRSMESWQNKQDMITYLNGQDWN